jgi:hypothetical protein
MTIVKEISGVVMNAVFVGTFLTIFFFTYASVVEGQIVKQQITFLANDLSQNIKLLPDNAISAIKTEIQNLKTPNFKSTDDEIDTTNNKIIKQTLIVVGSVFAVVLIIIYILSTKKLFNFSFMNLVVKNLIILVFIGLTEFVFLNLVARNFISVDPNYVKYYALNKLYPQGQVAPPPLAIDKLAELYPKRAVDSVLSEEKQNNVINNHLNDQSIKKPDLHNVFDNSKYNFSKPFNSLVKGFDGNILN